MKKTVLLMLLAVTGLLSACSGDDNAAVDIKDYVADLSGSNTVESASIDDRNLMVNDEGNEEVFKLPEDEFFVSIAPYLTYTHPCSVHSLTGCQGEMTEKPVQVLITDDDGNTHIDEEITTLHNGFIDLWLPRDGNYTIEISYEGKNVTGEFSTFEGDPTCLTDFHLT